MAARLATVIGERYLWPEEHYLYDSLRGSTPVARLRPNALRAVSAGLVDPSLGRAAVERVAEADLTTPWGVRCLSSRDPEYDPQAYHEGQVWTIATAWAADAAFEVGDRRRGLEYLRTIAARYRAEGGFAHECYRGDRAEPYDSRFLLGFSVAPFLTLLFERLWGLRILSVGQALRVQPGFPDGWTSAKLGGLRIAEGRIDLDWTPRRLRVRWVGPRTLSVEAGSQVRALASGAETEFELASASEI